MNLFGIRGLSFSWSRFLGISNLKSRVARATGIPTTKGGMERKVGRFLLSLSGLSGFITKMHGTRTGTSRTRTGARVSEKSRAAAEFAALQDISKGKKADMTKITNSAYVTKPPMTIDINAVPEDYIPQLTELGRQRLEEYIQKKHRL